MFTDILEADPDSLFPLQAALDYDIAQTLFIGANSLIVEGVSDLLILPSVSGVLESKKRAGLSDDWTITPVGGSDKVPTFVALLGSQKKLKVATLIDFQKKGQQTVENLNKKKLLAKKNVRTFADFTGTKEAEIEDMFDRQFYLRFGERRIRERTAEAHHPRGFGAASSRARQYRGAPQWSIPSNLAASITTDRPVTSRKTSERLERS